MKSERAFGADTGPLPVRSVLHLPRGVGRSDRDPANHRRTAGACGCGPCSLADRCNRGLRSHGRQIVVGTCLVSLRGNADGRPACERTDAAVSPGPCQGAVWVGVGVSMLRLALRRRAASPVFDRYLHGRGCRGKRFHEFSAFAATASAGFRRCTGRCHRSAPQTAPSGRTAAGDLGLVQRDSISRYRGAHAR